MKTTRILLPLLLILPVLAGCTASGPGGTGPASFGTPWAGGLVLWSESITESGQAPDYTIQAQIPQLQGSSDGRVLNFNAQMITLVYEDIAAFQSNLALLPAEPLGGGSSLDIRFQQLAPPGDLISIKFTVSAYTDGAAHPNSYSRTATYDLASGRLLTLADLFTPGMDFLTPLSVYCLQALQAGQVAETLMAEGAAPTAGNYSRWNVTAQGLLITFDPYQVAAYAAGQQLVTVPYTELQAIIDPDGPLAGYLR